MNLCTCYERRHQLSDGQGQSPREEWARQVLKDWYEKGYNLRHIMTEALLRLDEPQPTPVEEAVLEKVNEKLSRIHQLLERIGNRQTPGFVELEGGPSWSELTAGFLGMIRQAAKPGFRCD